MFPFVAATIVFIALFRCCQGAHAKPKLDTNVRFFLWTLIQCVEVISWVIILAVIIAKSPNYDPSYLFAFGLLTPIVVIFMGLCLIKWITKYERGYYRSQTRHTKQNPKADGYQSIMQATQATQAHENAQSSEEIIIVKDIDVWQDIIEQRWRWIGMALGVITFSVCMATLGSPAPIVADVPPQTFIPSISSSLSFSDNEIIQQTIGAVNKVQDQIGQQAQQTNDIVNRHLHDCTIFTACSDYDMAREAAIQLQCHEIVVIGNISFAPEKCNFIGNTNNIIGGNNTNNNNNDNNDINQVYTRDYVLSSRHQNILWVSTDTPANLSIALYSITHEFGSLRGVQSTNPTFAIPIAAQSSMSFLSQLAKSYRMNVAVGVVVANDSTLIQFFNDRPNVVLPFPTLSYPYSYGLESLSQPSYFPTIILFVPLVVAAVMAGCVYLVNKRLPLEYIET